MGLDQTHAAVPAAGNQEVLRHRRRTEAQRGHGVIGRRGHLEVLVRVRCGGRLGGGGAERGAGAECGGAEHDVCVYGQQTSAFRRVNLRTNALRCGFLRLYASQLRLRAVFVWLCARETTRNLYCFVVVNATVWVVVVVCAVLNWKE